MDRHFLDSCFSTESTTVLVPLSLKGTNQPKNQCKEWFPTSAAQIPRALIAQENWGWKGCHNRGVWVCFRHLRPDGAGGKNHGFRLKRRANSWSPGAQPGTPLAGGSHLDGEVILLVRRDARVGLPAGSGRPLSGGTPIHMMPIFQLSKNWKNFAQSKFG